MIKSVFKLLLTFLIFVAVFMLQRMIFILIYHDIITVDGIGTWWDIMSHGFAMDCSVAGYLTVLPALLYVTESITGSRPWLITTERIVLAVEAFLTAIIIVADAALYGYWGFRLDMTPVFYFTTSPGAALASATALQIIAGFFSFIIIAALIWFVLNRFALRVHVETRHRAISAAVTLLFTAALIIPIRGGTGVAPMNLSRAYFSSDQRLNHAAINPVFSLLYSATHQNKGLEEFHFFDTETAKRIFADYEANNISNSMATSVAANDADTMPLLRCKRPDVYLIILESFSAHLMPGLGGETIAVNLDSLAREGMSFTNFYANSFRTDRALPCILSAFPSLPSMSLLKHVEKIEKLPSMSETLKSAGYDTSYFYGGDITFANMQAYLSSCGFDNVISDKDFPRESRQSKWGAHDHEVFTRALNDVAMHGHDHPQFTVIQTSSSHEPFEVPYHNPKFASSPQKNAFAYTDSCLMAFVDSLRTTDRWDCTLVAIVPDHLGAWPMYLSDPKARHHVPFVMVGGALNRPHTTMAVPGSQTDIAATLLSALGIDSSDFPFSRDLLDSRKAHYGVFSETEIFGMVDDSGLIIYNIGPKQFNPGITAERGEAAKSYLQLSYEAMSTL